MQGLAVERVLCVDDEPRVLEGLAIHLRRRYSVVTATSASEGLAILRREPIAVLISDMRMPNMDGVSLLSHARSVAPDTVQMLLTGYADVEAAMAAVNEGRLFRFLTKPCSPDALLAAVASAVEQYRLVTAERVLLEQTLRGSVQTLADVLAIVHPAAFGRAMRIKRHVSELAEKLQLRERWPVEVAAMMADIGTVMLSPETVERIYFGLALSPEEQVNADRVPAATERLLGNIPRLEPVRAILTRRWRPFREADRSDALSRASQLLRVATDFDSLEARGHSSAVSLDIMRGRADQYDPEVLHAVAELRSAAVGTAIRELKLKALTLGMVFAEDVTLQGGALLVARGHELTEELLERMRYFHTGQVKEPLRVFVPKVKAVR